MKKIKIHSIIRSRRRTMALFINPDATLVIRAPLWARSNDIERMVHARHWWITKTIRAIRSRPRPIKHQFTTGEKFLYLGKPYRLRYADIRAIRLGDSLYVPACKRARVRDELAAWYQAQAARTIRSRVKFFAKKMGVLPTRIRISKAQTRWGSCGSGNTLNFNWRLVMAPPFVLDYVVVHELAHVERKHHAQCFWKAVAEILPDYRQTRAWLRTFGYTLKI